MSLHTKASILIGAGLALTVFHVACALAFYLVVFGSWSLAASLLLGAVALVGGLAIKYLPAPEARA